MTVGQSSLLPGRRAPGLLFLLLLVLLHLLLGHPFHGVPAHAPPFAEVSPEREDAEVESGDGPDDVHDPHLLRVLHLVDSNGESADKGDSE